ncbi:hypothetical protein BD309DRAFT_416447 [Dichomitus squalens]|nr:hypothetical protein BD309DRAFT_416447 [Dichomitus squalens]
MSSFATRTLVAGARDRDGTSHHAELGQARREGTALAQPSPTFLSVGSPAGSGSNTPDLFLLTRN